MAKKPITPVGNARAASQMKNFAQRHNTLTKDSFVNFAAKLGLGTNNITSGADYNLNPITRNHSLLEWMYRGSWMVGRLVDAVADDMTRAGIEINSVMPPEDIEQLNTVIHRLQLWQAINKMIKWARLYGGALAFMMIDGQDPETELRVETIQKGQFKGLMVLDRWMVQPSLARSELVKEMGPDLGLPMFYNTIQDAPVLPAMRIHYSRCLRMEGVELPYWQKITENLWSMSVIERVFDRLVAFDSTTQGAAQLVYKAYLRTLKVPQLRELIAAGGPALEGLKEQINFMRLMQSIEGVTVLDKDDEFDASEYSFSGLSDVLMQFGQQLSGASEIPLVRLFGQSPAGLNSTGESDLRNYYDGCKSQQEGRLRMPVDKLLRVTHLSEFGRTVPEGFGFQFAPLWQMTDQDKAEVASKVTTSVSTLMSGGIIGRKTALQELRQSSRVTGIFTNITEEEIESAEEDPPNPMEPGGGEGEDEGESTLDAQARLNPASVNYSPGTITEHCGICTHWVNGKCDIVIGAHDPNYWCTMFKLRGARDGLPQIEVHGIPVVIETPAGTERKGDGWTAIMPAHYGYVRGTDSAEGRDEQMDVFVGPNLQSRRVFVIDSFDPTTDLFDEHKCCLGFDDIESACDCFLRAYNDQAYQRLGGVTRMTIDQFKNWLSDGDHTKPLGR